MTFVTKVPVPQNWNFSKKRSGVVLLGEGGIPVTRGEISPLLTLLLPFKIRNPFYLTSRVTQNNDWIFENIRFIVKFVFIFFPLPSVYCDLALHTYCRFSEPVC